MLSIEPSQIIANQRNRRYIGQPSERAVRKTKAAERRRRSYEDKRAYNEASRAGLRPEGNLMIVERLQGRANRPFLVGRVRLPRT